MDSIPDQHVAEDEREKRLKGKEMRNQLPRVEVAAWDCKLSANEDVTLHITYIDRGGRARDLGGWELTLACESLCLSDIHPTVVMLRPIQYQSSSTDEAQQASTLQRPSRL
jgi:hypothetical protein